MRRGAGKRGGYAGGRPGAALVRNTSVASERSRAGRPRRRESFSLRTLCLFPAHALVYLHTPPVTPNALPLPPPYSFLRAQRVGRRRGRGGGSRQRRAD